MKIIQYPLPDISKMEVTQLSQAEVAGAVSLHVLNVAEFSVNDYIVAERVGNEFAELRLVTNTGTSPSQLLTISSAIIFNHQEGICIRKTPYNQARLYRSTDNITYTLLATTALDFQDTYGLITFIDNAGSDDYWYKVEYWNTTTSVGIMSGPIKTQTYTGYLSVEEFKRETGIAGDSETISNALRYGAENIKRNLFVKRHFEFVAPDTTFFLYDSGGSNNYSNSPYNSYGTSGCEGMEMADGNLNGVIDKNDFVVWEQAPDGARTYVTSDIVAIDVDRHMITFGTAHPTGSNKLVVECYFTFRKLDELNMKLRRLNMLYAVNYMFQNIPFKRLQRGIGSWTINGVSVTFENDMLRTVIEDNKKEIAMLLKEIAKVYIRFTSIHQPAARGVGWFKSTLHFQSRNVPIP